MTLLDFLLLAVHAVLFYSWIFFPAVLVFVRPRRAGLAAEATRSPSLAPGLAIVLSAYQEESCIAGRIRNLKALDYPPERWVAWVGVDGSKDRTGAEAAAAAAGCDSIRVLDFPVNRGKVAVLKDLVARARAHSPAPEILVFTDANTNFAPDALRRLCAPFSDPAVGGVCGRLIFMKPDGSETEENVYWRVENWLKARESEVDSCLGANGAIYAIRSSLFWSDIPSNTIIDDFVIGMKVRERNLRMVYEPAATATEALPFTIADEWKRRVRIGAGDFQALRLCAPCLAPSFGAFAWLVWSHKVLRWFTPHLALAGFLLALVGTLVRPSPATLFFLATYLLFIAAGRLGGRRFSRGGTLVQILRGVHYFTIMNAAIFAGFIRFCGGNLEGRWQRTER